MKYEQDDKRKHLEFLQLAIKIGWLQIHLF